VADKDAADIGDGVEFTGSAVKRNTKIARARFPGCFPLSERDERNEEKKYCQERKTGTIAHSDLFSEYGLETRTV